jgi:hypothetical protein
MMFNINYGHKDMRFSFNANPYAIEKTCKPTFDGCFTGFGKRDRATDFFQEYGLIVVVAAFSLK